MLCQRIADHLLNHHVTLPNGQHFTVEQFQTIGINLGRGHAALPMYYLLESAFVEVAGQPTLSYAFYRRCSMNRVIKPILFMPCCMNPSIVNRLLK